MLPEVKWHWCWCSFETDWIEDWIDFSPKLILEIYYIFRNRMKWAKHCAFDEMTCDKMKTCFDARWIGRCFCARQNAKGQEIDKEFNKYGQIQTYFFRKPAYFFGRKNFWAELNWTFSHSSPLACVVQNYFSLNDSFFLLIIYLHHSSYDLHTLKRYELR